jgi:predicted RNA binding protein YcfA (HicA-like mRNA interferase family)
LWSLRQNGRPAGCELHKLTDEEIRIEEEAKRIDIQPTIEGGDQNAMSRRKFLRKVLRSPRNIRFPDMLWLAEGFGFGLSRVRGSHHIMVHPEIPEVVNFQEVKGEAKPYQIKQFLKLVEKYHLELED